MRALAVILIAAFGLQADANTYAYTNADGDYVVSQKRPKDRNLGYAVLDDDGELIRMVPGRNEQLPISHWRPFWLPKEPNPLDGQIDFPEDREPDIRVEEVEREEEDGQPERP